MIDAGLPPCYNKKYLSEVYADKALSQWLLLEDFSLKEYMQRLKKACSRDNIRDNAKRITRFLLNPRLLLCLLIAWMITNGWSYVFFVVGMFLKINWMRVVGATYMGLLWLPFTPEKLITLLIAIGLLRLFFPHDRRTLGVLRAKLSALRIRMRKKVEP